MGTTQAGRLKFLLDQFAANALTESQFAELFELIGQEGNEAEVKAVLAADLEEQIPGSYDRLYWAAKFRELGIERREPGMVRRLSIWKRVAVAASIILLLGAGSFFAFFNKTKQNEIAKITPPVDISPGSNKAVLTLADGRQIILDEAENGNVAEQGSVTIIKVDGKLAYNKSGKESEVLYNTVTVPRKGQYQLVLADGTKIWLDAESYLRYPTSFPGSERTVELTGQGYFEVAKNAAKPFHVKTATQDVTVLGTHFNINSYANEESVKTTLIEGAVKITADNATQFLAPGQQAQLNKAGAISFIKNADTEQALAWKNGLFNFKSASLRSIMNQVVRWYDVEVVYEGNQSVSLSGYVDRNVPLSETLKLLASNGVHLRQEGKKIIMMQ